MSKISIVLLFLIALASADQNVTIRCFETGECLSSTSVGVNIEDDVDACALECQSNERCNYFSFNELNKACEFFANCLEFSNDTYYTSGPKNCGLSSSQCFSNVECLDSDVLNVSSVSELRDCKKKCNENEECSYYDFKEEDQRCRELASCPYYRTAEETVTASIFCPIKDYDCFRNFTCIGDSVDIMSSLSLETCHNYCQRREGCEWFVQDEEINICSLYATCTEKIECPSCRAGTVHCSHGLPNAFLHLAPREDGEGPNGTYKLGLSYISSYTSLEVQPDVSLIPQDLNLTMFTFACWSSTHGIAVFCYDGFCYHYDPMQDQWATNVTELLENPTSVHDGFCTELPNGDLLLTGILNKNSQVIHPSLLAPPQKSTVKKYTQ